MELLICGTAAAEGWPALFCVCDACAKARANGGKDVRTRAAYMIGEHLRVDFGPDSYLHQLKYGLRYELLEHLIVTHTHHDHWYPVDLHYRRAGYSVVPKNTLHVWGNAMVEERFAAANGDDWALHWLQYHKVHLWEPMDLCDGIRAVPILAAHGRGDELCVNYRITTADGRSLLVGHDTGWYPEETWEFLAAVPLHAVVMDSTYGPTEMNRGHLSCDWVVRARDEMAARGALASDVRFIAGHFSHNGGWMHDDLERYFGPHGIEVAFDGMRLTI